MQVTRQEVPGYAKITGILALVLAIVGWFIPIVGVLLITPLAIILCAISLYGGYKGMGIATTVIVIVNLLVSPSFWLNVAASSMEEGVVNRFLTYFDIIGVIVLLYLIVRKRPSTSVLYGED